MSDFPLHLADRCVKCGLCLPHCPTYRVTRDEGDSPRGRIALMQGLAGGMLPANERLRQHLDGCLTCRACEAVCPADVPYGVLIDSVREELAQEHSRQRPRLIAAVLTRPWLRAIARGLLWVYQRSGLQALLRGSGVLGRGTLGRLDSLLPRIARTSWQPSRRGAPTIALFANCTSPLAEPETLRAAMVLLEALGETVAVPAGQGCCGALHQHAGDAAQARALARANVAAFAAAPAIVSVASGCTAQLVEYGLLLPDDAPARGLARKARDLYDYLASHPRLDTLVFERLEARVLLQLPCTARNVLKSGSAAARLLARVPGLEISTWSDGCCGAAGSYMLEQPAMADALLAPLLERARGMDYVLSGNVGCSLHLAAGLRRAGLTAAVTAPAVVLARQLRAAAAIRAAA